MRDLSKGDRVITKSGLHAKVLDLNDNDNTCIIETMAGKLKIERSALSLEMSQKLNPAHVDTKQLHDDAYLLSYQCVSWLIAFQI